MSWRGERKMSAEEHRERVIFRMRQRQRKEKLFYNVESIASLLSIDCMRCFIPVCDQRNIIFLMRLVFTSTLENLNILECAVLDLGQPCGSLPEHIDIVLKRLEELHDSLLVLKWHLWANFRQTFHKKLKEKKRQPCWNIPPGARTFLHVVVQTMRWSCNWKRKDNCVSDKYFFLLDACFALIFKYALSECIFVATEFILIFTNVVQNSRECATPNAYSLHVCAKFKSGRDHLEFSFVLIQIFWRREKGDWLPSLIMQGGNSNAFFVDTNYFIPLSRRGGKMKFLPSQKLKGEIFSRKDGEIFRTENVWSNHVEYAPFIGVIKEISRPPVQVQVAACSIKAVNVFRHAGHLTSAVDVVSSHWIFFL